MPILHRPNFDSWAGTTKAAITADWKQIMLYSGQEFRMDSTDLAGDRWDKNLIGCRGEQEIGFNALPGSWSARRS